MGLTYTRGQDRARLRARRAPVGFGERLLILTSMVMLLAIVLAYSGRIRAEAWGQAGGPALLNLNVDADATVERLETPLAAVFADPRDRRSAATALAARLRSGDLTGASSGEAGGTRAMLPNVGALARIEVSGQPLFTPAQLAALKPLVVVRTIEEFRSAVVWGAIALVVSFQIVSLFWRWRGAAGDRILLALGISWSASAS